jgi:uncharacterized protein
MNLLLQHGACIHAANNDGKTILHSESECGETEVVARLLANGADVHAVDKCRWTPLNVEVACLLLENGANVHVVPDVGSTASHLGSESGRTEIICFRRQ